MIFNPVYGGNASANLGSKTITANGTYLASSDNLDGYDEVVANVPNSYTASDEGKVVQSQVGYIRTNNVALNITLSNWLYRTSDKFVLEYKNYGAHQATTYGVFGRFLETSSGDSAQLALQYNTYSGRKCMNIAHAGSWAGDGNYTFDAPDNLVKYYEVTGDGNSFVMKSGSSRGTYTTTEFSQTVGSTSDTDTTNVTLFPSNSGNVLNIEFYGLRVYRGGTLIHNYQPTEGGVYDAVDGTTYLATASGGTYGGGSYALVSQTSKSITANDTYDTTTNNSVVVNVPNSYSASDEGKVVSNGALVSQTSATYSSNNTYDTTLINSVTVNVPSSGGIEVITRSDWNALSVTQKQAYGLIAIQDAITGFDRGELVYGADYTAPIAAEYVPTESWNASNNAIRSYTFADTTLANLTTTYCLGFMSQNGTNPAWTSSLNELTSGAGGNGNYAIVYGEKASGSYATSYSGGNNWNNSEIVCFCLSGDAEPHIIELFYQSRGTGTYTYTYTATATENLLLVCMRGGNSGGSYSISGLTQKSHVTATGVRFNDVYFDTVQNGDTVSISIPYAPGSNSNGSLFVALMSVNVA